MASKALLFLLLGLILPGTVPAEWVSATDAIMGTRVAVELWHDDRQEGEVAVQAVLDEFRRLDEKLSPYKKSSELSLVNQMAAEQPVPISSEFYWLLEQSQAYAKLTKGAFDITFASIGHQYDYRTGKKPSQKSTQQTLPLINYQHLQLNPNHSTLFFRQPGVRIDLGGIAKGYAVDQGIALLQQRGIKHALISAGGDSRLLGDHQGRPWHIGIQAPRDQGAMAAVLPLSDSAISTSGDYERYFEADGIRYHHIISPKTGRSASMVQSVTIIGPNATRTDALSTSIFVLGPKAGMALINRLDDIEAVIIDKQGKMLTSEGLANLKSH
ncbi:MAG: FAD:protein FMN transferase [Candidatus Thiodiazotropha sp.]|jgi:FAD:protein FMN transferase